MSRPLPICATPTPDARAALLIAILAAGMKWCGVDENDDSDVIESHIRQVRAEASWTHAVAVSSDGIMFLTAPDVQYRTRNGIGTMVNSARHFVTYARRLKGQT